MNRLSTRTSVLSRMRSVLTARHRRMQAGGRDLGASAVEWVVISAIVVVIVAAVGVAIRTAIGTKTTQVTSCIGSADQAGC